jgi:hypothetical protein
MTDATHTLKAEGRVMDELLEALDVMSDKELRHLREVLRAVIRTTQNQDLYKKLIRERPDVLAERGCSEFTAYLGIKRANEMHEAAELLLSLLTSKNWKAWRKAKRERASS